MKLAILSLVFCVAHLVANAKNNFKKDIKPRTIPKDKIPCTEINMNCGPLTTPPNGNVDFSDTLQGTMATYMCDENYALSGSKTRVCGQDHKWTGTPAVCSRITCEKLDDPTDGSVVMSGTSVTSTATYSCTDNYHLDGPNTRICLKSGAWSGTEPTCEPFGDRPVRARALPIGDNDVSIENCPAEWSPYKSSTCHLIPTVDTEAKSWEDAEEYCKDRGGHLVKINDQDEIDHFGKLFPSSVQLWIGLNDKEKEGRFVWVSDNSTVDYANWWTHEPNNRGNREHCVLTSINYKWFDVPCHYRRRPLCEKLLYVSVA